MKKNRINHACYLSRLVSNKLYHVKDAVSPNLYDNDFENATSFNTSNPSVNNNYQYDANGNLAADVVEQMQEIQWNSIGKIKAIIRTSGSVKPDIEYGYRADGQRLYKLVKPKESNGALKQELSWVYTYYVRDLEGNVMATYEKTMESTTTANTYKENYKASAWDLFGSSRLGVLSEKNNLISTREFTKFGTTNSGSWVDRTYTGAATLTTMNAVIHTITRGNKQFELCNHLGNVLVTVQDRKRSVDINTDNAADYYLPYLRTVTNYYAFGSAMPGIGGSIKECTVTSSSATLKKYPYYHTFSNDSLSGFTAGSGARTVSNPTHNVLHLESIWSTRPLATKTVYLKNGVNYSLKLNITGFSVVSGYTHTVRVRILLPGSTITNNYTATGIQTINFTSNTTGNVTIEISSQINGSGSYGVNPYINLDDFSLSWDSAYTAYINNCNLNPDNYKYGFNTQEKDNEVAGENNFYTAEYWEYDARIARRWNVDPVFKEFESPYSCFSGNPILFNDINGDDISVDKDGEGPKKSSQQASKYALPNVYEGLNPCSDPKKQFFGPCVVKNSSTSYQDASFKSNQNQAANITARKIAESKLDYGAQKADFDKGLKTVTKNEPIESVGKSKNQFTDNTFYRVVMAQYGQKSNYFNNVAIEVNYRFENPEPIYNGPLPSRPNPISALIPFYGTKVNNSYNDEMRSLGYSAPENSSYAMDAVSLLPFGGYTLKSFSRLELPIYRVYGGGSNMYGKSYSLINPQYVPFYRIFAGLPKVNTGEFLLKGTIPLKDIKIGRAFAKPLDGNIGGLPFELYQNFNQLKKPQNIILKKPF